MNKTNASKYLPTLKNFYELTNIPVCLCDKSGIPLYFLPHHSVMASLAEYLPHFIKKIEQHTDQSHVPVIRISTLGSFNGFIRLDKNIYLIAGPVTASRFNRADILTFYQSWLPTKLNFQLCDALVSSPLYTYRRFLSALSLITELCTGHHFTHEEIVSLSQSLLPVVEQQPVSPMLLEFDKTVCYTDILNYENGICEAVSSGNPELLKKHLAEPTHIPFGRPSGAPLEREKYSFVSLTSLVLRSAIRGGMPRSTAFMMGDEYVQKLSDISAPAGIHALTYKMVYDYCEQVKNARAGNNYSPIARKCQNYIFGHLHDSINLNTLAEFCDVSPRTISAHFRKVFNMSASEYIMQERLKEAKYLLAHTSFQIAEISHLLKFSSQSHFTRIFRENFGYTPQQYRSNHNQ